MSALSQRPRVPTKAIQLCAEQGFAGDGVQRALRARFPPRLKPGVCAGHGTELTGCKSPCQVVAEPQARRRTRASPRGDVGRKSNPKVRGDAQAPERRGGTPGTRGHVTAKSSLRNGVCVINPAVTHRQLGVLPRESCMLSIQGMALGELSAGEPEPIGRQQSAEGIVCAGQRRAQVG
jgi:hypothetical protein